LALVQTTGPDEKAPVLDDDVRKAVIEKYYDRFVGASDAARQRAQAAYAVASAIAAGLVAAGAFGGLDERPLPVKILGPTALAAWLLTAWLFLLAVSVYVRPPKNPDSSDQVKGAFAFVTEIRRRVAHERGVVDCLQQRARRMAAAAGILTVAALILAVFLPAPVEQKDGQLKLSPAGMTAVDAICPIPLASNVLDASIETATVDDEIVRFELPPGTCGPEATPIEAPQADVDLYSYPLD
jgi:hypothetical protein